MIGEMHTEDRTPHRTSQLRRCTVAVLRILDSLAACVGELQLLFRRRGPRVRLSRRGWLAFLLSLYCLPYAYCLGIANRDPVNEGVERANRFPVLALWCDCEFVCSPGAERRAQAAPGQRFDGLAEVFVVFSNGGVHRLGGVFRDVSSDVVGVFDEPDVDHE